MKKKLGNGNIRSPIAIKPCDERQHGAAVKGRSPAPELIEEDRSQTYSDDGRDSLGPYNETVVGSPSWPLRVVADGGGEDGEDSAPGEIGHTSVTPNIVPERRPTNRMLNRTGLQEEADGHGALASGRSDTQPQKMRLTPLATRVSASDVVSAAMLMPHSFASGRLRLQRRPPVAIITNISRAPKNGVFAASLRC